MRTEDKDTDFGCIPDQGMITAIKTIMLNGTSLTVNITREVKELGLDRGNRIMVILKPMDE